MNDPVTVPEELVRRVQARSAIPLIGAGVSQASGAASWSQVVARFRHGIEEWTGRRVGEEELDLLAVPRLYAYLQQSRQPMYRVLEDAVERGFRPNLLHERLVQMPLPSLLTTNWDTLLERALRAAAIDLNVIRRDADVAGWQESRGTQVIKMHGCITVPETIVVSEDDYHRFYAGDSMMLTLVKALMGTRSMFAVGFSMRDQFVKMLFSHVARLIGPTANPHYVVVPADDNPLVTSYLESAGFITVRAPVSDGDPFGTRAFLDALHEKTYSWTTDRLARTRLLHRETAKLRHHVGADHTIRIRATMGPLATPPSGDPYDDPEQSAAEQALATLCIELVEQHGARIKLIGTALERDFIRSKGYSDDVYEARLRALVETAERLGDRFEYAPAMRPSDANSWQVGSLALVDSKKRRAGDQRLFEHSELIVDANTLARAQAWFDEEFDQLVGAGGAAQARADLIAQGHTVLGS